MVEKTNRFYLYDRWFNFIKETDDKIVYSSNKKKKGNSINVEIDKETSDMSILYLSDKKMLAKLDITDIDTDSINFHYQEQEPQLITINDNVYVNLILELTTSIDRTKFISEKIVRVNKKKKLNKMCYLEPDFPINEDINLKDVDIDSDMFSYFLNLIDYIKGYVRSLETLMEKDKKTSTIAKLKQEEKNLVIAEELFIYDRNYNLVARDDRTLYYENHQDGITNLEIKMDPNKYLTSINFVIENETPFRTGKNLLQIIRNDLGGVTVRFTNRKKSSLRISGDTFKDYDDAKFKYETVYDQESNVVYNNVEVVADNDEYSLTYHPSLSNIFIDENGNAYRINGQDFCLLDSISSFAPGIFENVEKTLTKKAN